MREMIDRRRSWILIILGGVVLVNIKRVFIDFDIDCEYAIALSYRMARGDHMITQMWEPHQTSAFLNAFLIKIYMLLTGTTTGIALYLNMMGLIAKLGVVLIIYRTLLDYCNKSLLFFMCAFFMTVNAKKYLILDFSNMMIYFLILLWCTLYMYIQRQEQGNWNTGFLVLAAVCFCLEVLAYPSTVILFPLLLIYLGRYCVRKRRDIMFFSVICAAIGSSFLAYLLMQSGWERFWLCSENILMGDSTHQVGNFSEQLKQYAMEIGLIATIFTACMLLSILIVKILIRKGILSSKSWYIKMFFLLLFAENFCQTLVRISDDFMWLQDFYSAVYIPVLILGFCFRKYCDSRERMLFDIGAGISIGGFIAVLLLTNLTFLTTVAYLIPGVMVSMIPIGNYLHRMDVRKTSLKISSIYSMLILFIVVVIFKNFYVFRSLSLQDATLPYVRSVVKAGPMKGIFSDYMGGYIRNVSLEQWMQYVQEGDKVLIVSSPASVIGYLYEDVEICIDSTISTPTYDEKLLLYWELNPCKEPDVVVLDCWFGEPRISQDTWIMHWIEENFDTYVDGAYIRIYRKSGM